MNSCNGTDPQSSAAFPRPGISGFVLAGGKSSRLGQDKVLLPWNGKTLLQHAIDRLQQVCGVVRICANREDLLAFQDVCIHDAVPDAGPLGGIVAALEHSQTSWNFFLAVDLPLVPVAFLQALIDKVEVPGAQSAPQCVLPEIEARPQPLCGLYHLDLAPGLRRALLEGRYKIILALDEAVARIPNAELQLIPAEDLAASANQGNLRAADYFQNVNTPQDWQRMRELAVRPAS